MSDALEIRPLRTFADFQACVALQEATWGEGFSERVPTAMLRVAARLGGVVAGAFDEEGELAGFVFGLTGLEDGRPAHWSDMLAVRADRRGQGLGARLKAYQRERLLEMGVDTVYWSFDPLVARNGWLNFGKLGAVSREYVRDMYGDSGSPLHRGIGTDRLVVLWSVAGPRVAGRLDGDEAPPELEAVAELPRALDALPVGGGDRHPRPGEPREDVLSAPRCLVAVPAGIHALREDDVGLAAAWRQATRTVFEVALDGSREVRELVPGAGAVSFYLVSAVE